MCLWPPPFHRPWHHTPATELLLPPGLRPHPPIFPDHASSLHVPYRADLSISRHPSCMPHHWIGLSHHSIRVTDLDSCLRNGQRCFHHCLQNSPKLGLDMAQDMKTSIYGAPTRFLAWHRYFAYIHISNNPVRKAFLSPFRSGRLRDLSQAASPAKVEPRLQFRNV